MGDFDKLGFEVTAEGNALNTFNQIYLTLEKIKKLGNINLGVGVNGRQSNRNLEGSKPKLTDEERWEKQYQDRIKKQIYYLKQGYIQQKNIISEHKKWVIAEEKKLEKKKFLTEQGYIQEKPKFTDEEKYLKKVTAEKEKLNSKTYEEARRIELANKERQKEIDQRLKQELGIQDNSKALSKYLAKFTSIIVVVKKLAHFTSQAIKETADYTENLNLFAVAYGKTYKQQLEWATGIAEAYGLANNEVIKFAGTFRELSSSLGLVGDTADIVTKAVTNLGYDFSALFNTSVEDAMEKLQSGIFSGNVRPLRSFGIDISQGQIDELFETNEALSKLGISARNLSQSEKTIARLIITLQSGKDSFGTMAREINNLQSQFRIFQGSLSNFKLAIGDLVNKPLSDVMVVVNAFIIAITNAIRSFVPLKKDDDTPKAFLDIADNAESATEEIEKLSGSLAGFDKFNVLQKNEGGNSLATEELTNLLQEQVSLYDSELTAAMEKMQNEAVELAEKLQDILVVGGIFFAVFSASKFLGVVKFLKTAKEGISVLSKSFLKLNDGVSLTNGLFLTGLIFTIYKAVEAFKEGDIWGGILATAIGVVLVTAWALLNKEIIATKATGVIDFFKGLKKSVDNTTPTLLNGAKAFETQKLSINQVANSLAAMAGGYLLADSFLNTLDGDAKKTASTIMLFAGAITALTVALLAMQGTLTWGAGLPIILGSIGVAIAGFKSLMADASNIQGFANGGITDANLIMTNENGVKEWVGQQGQSTAVVNDTQMSDVMRQAVAQGVYNALTAYSQQNGQKQTEQPIKVIIGDNEVFTVVRKVAKRQGLDFAKA